LSPLAHCGDEGGNAGQWIAGMIQKSEAPSDKLHPTLYPVGCCFLCPRDAFFALGGFDERLVPFYWEDTDLGYRAWRRGWRVLHMPQAICHHEGSATVSLLALEVREYSWARNRALFHLLNLEDPMLRAENAGALAALCLFEGRDAH